MSKLDIDYRSLRGDHPEGGLLGSAVVAPLTSAMLEPLFRIPDRLGASSAWWGHVPFAGWLMRASQPRIFVELGTFSGVSYSAFCQAALEDCISCACHAVDTWLGDSQCGFYDDTIYLDFKAFHDHHYQAISQIHRCTFDEALTLFDERSVDLVHIDGYHTYEAVKHDFETWLPKLSSRGVLLLHDTNERINDFGVYRLWDEVSNLWPSFSFLHSHGLGVLCIGTEPPPAVAAICAIQDPQLIETIRQRFAFLGDRWSVQARATKAEERVRVLEGSASWRLTAPLRYARSRFPWPAPQARARNIGKQC